MQIKIVKFYPEEFRRKTDKEKYQAKGTCEVSLQFESVQMDIKNITYRIDLEGKVLIKPPFRVYSHKKKGQKPKLVPSIKFGDPEIWPKIEEIIQSNILESVVLQETQDNQLYFWEQGSFA